MAVGDNSPVRGEREKSMEMAFQQQVCLFLSTCLLNASNGVLFMAPDLHLGSPMGRSTAGKREDWQRRDHSESGQPARRDHWRREMAWK